MFCSVKLQSISLLFFSQLFLDVNQEANTERLKKSAEVHIKYFILWNSWEKFDSNTLFVPVPSISE